MNKLIHNNIYWSIKTVFMRICSRFFKLHKYELKLNLIEISEQINKSPPVSDDICTSQDF